MKSLYLNFLWAALLAFPQFLLAQDYPPDAEPGKCYAKCLIPDEYENITESLFKNFVLGK
ncbi:hypothetical protein [Saprospira grandis]|uniref:hypothetical protein n=1 Tax=Saprospira grandis TaxID=1008 RepID=UPI00031E66FD|nr:hypothetical protein [Saprospira grandis]